MCRTFLRGRVLVGSTFFCVFFGLFLGLCVFSGFFLCFFNH